MNYQDLLVKTGDHVNSFYKDHTDEHGTKNFSIMLVVKNILPVVFSFAFIFFISCGIKTEPYKSPVSYDFNTPVKFVMKDALREISGITFLTENDDTIYAVEDETGKLYSFVLGSQELNYSNFDGRGDYEDITVFKNNSIAILKSNGSILLIPSTEIGKESIDSLLEYKRILPEGEYEGLFAADDKLYALCKNCSGDKGTKEVSVFTMERINGAPLRVTNTFKVDISMVMKGGQGKQKFNPSCLSLNPVTKEWFIISSVNKVLVVLNEQWKVKGFYPLNPSLFKQPEGLTFNRKGDLFISNEGGGGSANILLFRYRSM